MSSVFKALDEAISAITLADGATGDVDARAALSLAKETIQAKITLLKEI